MRADIQERIAPMTPKTDKSFSDLATKKNSGAIDSTGPAKKTDFRDLLFNSNQDTKLDREAKANGSFTNAKSESDFLEQLQKRNEPVRVPKNNLDKDDFLKLFVTQLQNQDPLNPDDSTEMASKLAHFNSLEQMLNVNKTLDKMLVAQSNDRQLGLVDYVGKEITVGNGRIRMDGGKVSDSSFFLSAPSAETTMQVRDGSGVLLFEKEAGSMPVGTHKFAWDGKDRDGKQLGDGIYTYSVVAKSMDAQEIPVNITSRVKVLGVDLQDPSGSVFTDFGRVKLQDIRALGSDGFDQSARKQADLAIKEANAPKKAPQNIEDIAPQAVSEIQAELKKKETTPPSPEKFDRNSDQTKFIMPGVETTKQVDTSDKQGAKDEGKKKADGPASKPTAPMANLGVANAASLQNNK